MFARNFDAKHYHDPLFGPYDPNRHYTHVRYFEVGKVDFEHVQAPFVIGCWILIAGLAKMAFHSVPHMSRMVPESCLLIGLGIGVGALLYVCLGDIEASHHLDPDTFFLYMLPPIILDAGYFMPNRLFFDNLGTILLMAVVGTIFSTFAIAGGLYLVGMTGVYGVETSLLDILLFSALISAVDPVAVLAVFEEIQVNDVLYIVVFGESLLNDAVTVGLYHMFEEYMILGHSAFRMTDIGKGFVKFASAAVGGTFIGVVWGFVTAFLTRFTDKARVMEPIFVFTMPFLAYLNAEIFHLSGILSITFCGLTMKNYVITNVSTKSHTTIKYMMKMLASCSETAIFMLLGVATVHNHHDWNLAFVLATILFCVVFRSISVVVLTAFANRLRLRPIAAVDVFVMAYGGLRGAVAFALVMLIDPHLVKEQQMFLTTTISVVYFTVFVQGMTIKPLVKRLGVERANKRKLTMNERIHERTLDHLKAGVENIVGHPLTYNVRHRFKQFNHQYLLPCLTRGHHNRARDPKIMETFSRLVMMDAMQNYNDVTNMGQSSQRLTASSSLSVSDAASGSPALAPPAQRRFSYRRHVTQDAQLPNPVLSARDQVHMAQDMDARLLLWLTVQPAVGWL
ncbi:sodium/hydrogen exchanger 1-like [Pollicipes pollicipes]|uniref:sodium/hydrogen exchanger 1-like n=1 Tax=Pollicipes pollicipes TaxID=41117 RepID=UPI0018853047|nr:sodium/hydrogen exchanger 1-like [Pollicipes pollicipes]